MAILKDLLVNGNSSLLGTTTAVSILPQIDASYNLGSSGFGWNTIYLDKASDDNARHQGIRFLNDTTEVANIGATSIGLGLYGNGNVYIRPSLTATNQGFTITSTAIVPAANNTIDLGQHSTTDNTIKYRWKNIYLQGVLDYIMDANTSNAKTQLRIKDTANTSIAEIGFYNTGDTNGAFYIIPAFKNITGNSYNGQNGLWIGKNNLKWENKYLLRYSATATTDQLLIADGTAGNVKTSGKTITADAPTSSSDDTTVPTSAAVWSAVDALTDTKNTAGSTNTSSKIYLIGAIEQATNPQTYSDDQVYVTNGTLYLVKATDLSGTVNNKPALIVGGADTAAHMEFDANEIQAKGSGTTTAPLYLNNDGGLVTVGAGGIATGALKLGGGGSSTETGKTLSSSSTLYINRGDNCSIIFRENGTSYIQIDPDNSLSPVTSQAGNLNLGLNANRWKMVYTNGVKIGNNTVATNTDGCTMQYDETLQTLKFVFV